MMYFCKLFIILGEFAYPELSGKTAVSPERKLKVREAPLPMKTVA